MGAGGSGVPRDEGAGARESGEGEGGEEVVPYGGQFGLLCSFRSHTEPRRNMSLDGGTRARDTAQPPTVTAVVCLKIIDVMHVIFEDVFDAGFQNHCQRMGEQSPSGKWS